MTERPDEYLQHEAYGFVSKLPDEVMRHFGRLVLKVVASHRPLSEPEWHHVAGRAAAMGVGAEVTESWRSEYQNGSLETEVKAYWNLLGERSAMFLYEAIKTARVAGYDVEDRRAVRRAAEACGVSEAVVRQIEAVCESEDALRRVRIGLLHPQPTLFHDPSALYDEPEPVKGN